MALEIAEKMCEAPVDVPDDLFARAATLFSDAQLVELAATAALENFRARFNRVFRIEPNTLYCPVDPIAHR